VWTPSRRDELARYAAPVAFLVAITILVLLVRAGINGGGDGGSSPSRVPVSTAAATTSATTTTPASTVPRKPKKQFYAVERGDTFGVIASKFDTTVEALQALNPGVSSNSLTIGQKLRVK
jgi:LysM repeat protein